jgi:F-type H+-transporting ATPase subunit gamma
MSLKDVKNKINAISKIHQVTKAMEAVSAVKMRRSQDVAIEMRPFAMYASGLLHRLVKRGATADHELIKAHDEVKNILMIVITSDRGLGGPLNSYILKTAHEHINEKGWKKEQVKILSIGKKGYEYFSKRGFKIVQHIERWGEGVPMGDPSGVADILIKDYVNNIYDKVMLIYGNFESTFSQSPVVRRLLPISFPAVEELIDGIVPEKGKYSELRNQTITNGVHRYTFEPDEKTVLDELLPYLIGVLLYHAVLQANASEHSARMVAMKSASDRARDLTRDLTLVFNKERQTGITAEVSEITSGIEAMR